MGRPKEEVRLADGRTMIEHVIAALSVLEAPIHLSCSATPSPYLLSLGLPFIKDSELFAGPLFALVRALEDSDADRILVVCCDQPRLQSDMLQALLAISADNVPTVLSDTLGNRYDPFPCVIPSGLLDNLRAFVAGGGNSPRRWLSCIDCRWFEIHPSLSPSLASFNSEDDLRHCEA